MSKKTGMPKAKGYIFPEEFEMQIVSNRCSALGPGWADLSGGVECESDAEELWLGIPLCSKHWRERNPEKKS